MSNINRLLEIMQQLRDPETGCPWDLEQDFNSIIPHTIEETYEVVDAIESATKDGNWDSVKDELGDLLFQVVFYAQLGKERNLFEFDDVVTAISEKLVRRHPHVFADAKVKDVEEQTLHWEQLKQQEKAARLKHTNPENESILDDVTATLPALTYAYKLQKKVAQVGFDWTETGQVIEKLDEEINEFKIASDAKQQLEELGDVLFSCVNLIRHLGSDPESVMRATNNKFSARFRKVETLLKQQGKDIRQNLSIDELEAAWQRAKR